MTQAIQANELTLSEVEDQFYLRQVLNESEFFAEWQTDLPELASAEVQACDRIKIEFLYLNKYPMLKDLVKMVMLSPLLSLAGFYRPPIRPVLEKITFSAYPETSDSPSTNPAGVAQSAAIAPQTPLPHECYSHVNPAVAKKPQSQFGWAPRQ